MSGRRQIGMLVGFNLLTAIMISGDLAFGDDRSFFGIIRVQQAPVTSFPLCDKLLRDDFERVWKRPPMLNAEDAKRFETIYFLRTGPVGNVLPKLNWFETGKVVELPRKESPK